MKLWAVAGSEVLVQPYDAGLYASSALDLVWGSYGFSLHAPGVSMIAGLIGQLGLPWRIALEVLFLTSAGFFVHALHAMVPSRLALVFLFSAIAWHPWTFSAFSEFMACHSLTWVFLLLFALMFRILGRPASQWKLGSFICLGVVLFLWEWARTEDPLVYCTGALFAVVAVWLSRSEFSGCSLQRRLTLAVVPLLTLFCLSSAIKTANYAKYGVYAKSRYSQPGMLALLDALYHVQPERNLKYAAVTRQSLQVACVASPTLRFFEAALLDPQSGNTRIGERITGVPGEFGPWLNMLLADAFARNAGGQDNAAMLAAAQEINQAFRSGLLPRRTSLFVPLDPNWRLWLPDLAPAVWKTFRSAASFQPWEPWETTADRMSEFVFDAALFRRSANAESKQVLVSGFVNSDSKKFSGVLLTDSEGCVLGASAFRYHIAKDLPGPSFSFRTSPAKAGYNLHLLTAFSETSDWDRTGTWWPTNGYKLTTNAIISGDGRIQGICACRAVEVVNPKLARFEFFQSRAKVLCILFLAVALVCGISSLVFKTNDNASRMCLLSGCIFILACWLVARLAVYGLLDANLAWTVDRYMRCVSPIMPAIFFLVAMWMGQSCLSYCSRKGSPADK